MNNLLKELARQLNSIVFEFTPAQTATITKRLAGDLPLYNVASGWPGALGRGARDWRVRMRIAGEQRILGVAKSIDTAARFADMCHFYFIKLGVRTFRINDFNFDAETADSDLQHPVAGPLLGEIASFLFPNGVPEKPVRASKLSKAELVVQLKRLQYNMQSVNEEIAKQRLDINALKSKITPV